MNTTINTAATATVVLSMDELIARKAELDAATEATNAALAKAMADAEKAKQDAENAVRESAIAEVIAAVKASLEAAGLSVADLRNNEQFADLLQSAVKPRASITEQQQAKVKALVAAGIPVSIAAEKANVSVPSAKKMAGEVAERTILTLGDWNTDSRGRRTAAVEEMLNGVIAKVLTTFPETVTETAAQ